jgi:hypothetical protein
MMKDLKKILKLWFCNPYTLYICMILVIIYGIGLYVITFI